MTNEIFDPFNLPDSVCAHLCCKEMVCGKGPPRDPALVYPGDEECKAFFWCEETQDAQGPDGEIVGFEFCRTHRSCCASRVVPRPQA